MSACGIYSFLSRDFSRGKFSITLNTIRMRANYPNNKIVVVEGKSDTIVLSERFNSRIHLLPPFCKGNAEKIILQIGKSFKNVIAILDRDYDPITNDQRIFYYDHCNLEMMVVSADNVFANILSPLSINTLIEYRDQILMHLKPLSCLRLLNSMSVTTGCKEFSAIKVIGNLLNCLSLDNDGLIRSIRSGINSNLIGPSITNTDVSNILVAFNNNIVNLMKRDVYDITNGHDFNELLIFKLSPYQNITDDMGPNSIYYLYKNAFTDSEFKNTELYRNLKCYCTNNGYDFLDY